MTEVLLAAIALVSALLPLSSAASASSAPPPNLLFILADDLGHNDVGWANGRTISPNLDALAKGGMELTQWYVFKYCAPTRGMINTGRYPFHFGFYNNQDSNDCAPAAPCPAPCLPSKLSLVANCSRWCWFGRRRTNELHLLARSAQAC